MRDRFSDVIVWVVVLTFLAGVVAIIRDTRDLLQRRVAAQAERIEPTRAVYVERIEPEFVRVNKAVEAVSYDARGVRNGSWTETITMMRHRATGACWIGSYTDNAGHITWTPAPPAVCQ